MGFWKTLPGILTGLAAVITALGGLYVVLIDRQESQPTVAQSARQEDPPPLQARPQDTEWTDLADVSFVNQPEEWEFGRFPTAETPQMEMALLEGKYRWSMQTSDAFSGPSWTRIFPLPYGPKVEFYAAIDVSIVESSAPVSASLVFGKRSNADYSFSITSNNLYSLSHYDNGKIDRLVDWTSFEARKTNRLAVESVDGRLTLSINSKIIGEQLWHQDFLGGGFALSVSSRPNQSAVVDFDNFVLRVPK